MAIDLYRKGRVPNRKAIRQTKSTNVYIKLLIKLYKFLARRTGAPFNRLVLKRLNQTNVTRAPIGLGRLIKVNQEGKINVIIATVTDDERILEVPKLTVACLRVTEAARKRILAAGGTILTLDQLALKAPKGTNCAILRGPKNREALRHFRGLRGYKNIYNYLVNTPPHMLEAKEENSKELANSD